MRKFLLYLLLLAVAASAASCRKAVEKAQRNIRFEGIEKIERQGLTGAEIVVGVRGIVGAGARGCAAEQVTGEGRGGGGRRAAFGAAIAAPGVAT